MVVRIEQVYISGNFVRVDCDVTRVVAGQVQTQRIPTLVIEKHLLDNDESFIEAVRLAVQTNSTRFNDPSRFVGTEFTL